MVEFQWYRLWVSIGWVLISIIVYLSLTFNPPNILEFTFADKLKHMFAYGVLMSWFGQLYVSKQRQIFWAIGLGVMGVALEFVQGWGGHRFFDVADMAANTLGVLLGWWFSNRWLAGSLLRVDHILSRMLGKV